MVRWNNRKAKRKRSRTDGKGEKQGEKHGLLTSELSHNLQEIRQAIGHAPDVVIHEFMVRKTRIRAAVIYVSGLSDTTAVQEHLLKPLMSPSTETDVPEDFEDVSRLKDEMESIVRIHKDKEVDTLDDCILEVLSGNTILLIEGSEQVLVYLTPGWKTRTPEEPITESVVRGPRDGFVESLNQNIVLLRRRIKDPDFTMVNYQIGRRSKHQLSVVYIRGIANGDLVNEVKRRVERIDIDDLQESGFIEQLIEDNYLSPFPQVQNTERPDRVMAALMEGRVAILLDGTPSVLIVPVTFSMLLQAPEDYYERWLIGTLIRLMRFGATLITLFLPALYIALVSYHQGLIPTKLVISIAATREGVPFPSFIEAFMMEVMIEVLREAGLRLPKQIGQAVGIVGGLVIGEAAVTAGIVSPVMVIVVASTAVASFAVPQYGAGISLRMLRFLAMFTAAVLGLYGIILFFLMVSIHLVKLKSFGVHYTSPLAPYRPRDWKDFFYRMPLFRMKRRPKLLDPEEEARMKSRLDPIEEG
ncbi:spore germination protein [Salinithrix halophila]|uniref:Spore germination protein n=1 Tax=Salinithrix halophila TaxID=1485204 RepID=A0ABV8JDR4_9BACL